MIEFDIWGFIKDLWAKLFSRPLTEEEKTLVLKMQKNSGECLHSHLLSKGHEIHFNGKTDDLIGPEWVSTLDELEQKGYVTTESRFMWYLTHKGKQVRRSRFVLDPP